MKTRISLLLSFISLTVFAQSKTPTTIYLVRHAEKMTNDPAETNPSLSSKGTDRAIELAQTLKDSPISTIYTTDTNRTWSTAAPTSEYKGIDILKYDAKNLNVAATTILKENKGKTILIIGHSNTVLETIEALGGKRPIENIGDLDYNNLFLLVINSDGTTTTTLTKYGAAN